MTRIPTIGLLLACLLPPNPVVMAAQGEAGEYLAKARFLANAPEFVEWPSSAFQTAAAPLLICVHGDFSFGTTLAEQTRGVSVRGHRVEVKWARAEQDLPPCRVLFVSHSAAKNYARILQVAKESGALTIGEDPDFLKTGGMVSLQPASRGVIFDVNLGAVEGARLKISSQLLSLARHVFRAMESAQG